MGAGSAGAGASSPALAALHLTNVPQGMTCSTAAHGRSEALWMRERKAFHWQSWHEGPSRLGQWAPTCRALTLAQSRMCRQVCSRACQHVAPERSMARCPCDGRPLLVGHARALLDTRRFMDASCVAFVEAHACTHACSNISCTTHTGYRAARREQRRRHAKPLHRHGHHADGLEI